MLNEIMPWLKHFCVDQARHSSQSHSCFASLFHGAFGCLNIRPDRALAVVILTRLTSYNWMIIVPSWVQHAWVPKWTRALASTVCRAFVRNLWSEIHEPLRAVLDHQIDDLSSVLRNLAKMGRWWSLLRVQSLWQTVKESSVQVAQCNLCVFTFWVHNPYE